MKKILVVGSVNMDFTVYTDVVPRGGETVRGSGFLASPGGKGANQATAAARLGGDVSMFCAVGADMHGDILRAGMKKNKIRFCGRVLPDTESGTAVIVVSGGENRIIVTSGANGCITPALLDENEALFADADFVILQLEIPVPAVLHAAELAKKHGAFVILNPAPYAPLPETFFPLTDLIIPNEHEAAALTGADPSMDSDGALAALMRLGVKGAIITLGENGSVYTKNGTFCRCPAKKVAAVDTTAAGDTFIGALSVSLAGGNSIDAAVSFATAASAYTVCHKGATESIPYLSDLQKD